MIWLVRFENKNNKEQHEYSVEATTREEAECLFRRYHSCMWYDLIWIREVSQ